MQGHATKNQVSAGAGAADDRKKLSWRQPDSCCLPAHATKRIGAAITATTATAAATAGTTPTAAARAVARAASETAAAHAASATGASRTTATTAAGAQHRIAIKFWISRLYPLAGSALRRHSYSHFQKLNGLQHGLCPWNRMALAHAAIPLSAALHVAASARTHPVRSSRAKRGATMSMHLHAFFKRACQLCDLRCSFIAGKLLGQH